MVNNTNWLPTPDVADKWNLSRPCVKLKKYYENKIYRKKSKKRCKCEKKNKCNQRKEYENNIKKQIINEGKIYNDPIRRINNCINNDRLNSIMQYNCN